MPLPHKPVPKTILLAENEPLLLRLVHTILERAGFAVLSATTAEVAIRIEQDFRGTIDLLLTGVSMPRLSGPELAEQLKSLRPELRVMLMSSDPAARTLAFNRGWHFIEKPFLPSALLDRINSALQDL
jgi:two-component system cell cycle sensor histidine kinase/response regulator CckA